MELMVDPDGGELGGRVILITGASRGLGRAVATACAAAGATVLICARDAAALESVAAEIEAAGRPSPVILPIDLAGATRDDFSTVGERIDAQFGRLDGVVANAAILGELAPLASYDPMTWARVFQVNVHSVFLLLQMGLPLLGRADDAALVFTLAPEGESGRAHWGAYGASKSALRSMLEILIDEYEAHPKLRVHGVMPQPLRTGLRLTAFPASDAESFPLPDTAAPTFVELLGPRSRHGHGRIVRL